MADAIGRRMVSCLEPEASGRGAAMLAAEQMKLISDLTGFSPAAGAAFEPHPENAALYTALLKRTDEIFDALYGDSPEHSLIH